MPRAKTNYTELVHRIIRDSQESLAFEEIFRRVNELAPVTTKHPKGTIRSAITQSSLIVSHGDGTYGWKFRVINGSILRLSLYESDLKTGRVGLTSELIEALFPAFFGAGKRQDRAPIQLRLSNGSTAEWTLEMIQPGRWGTKGSVEFWNWFKPLGARVGDALIFRVVDGDARDYAVEFQPRAERDESSIAHRNDELLQLVDTYLERNPRGAAVSGITSHLLGIGFYKHPVPPDAFEELWAQRSGGPAPGKAKTRHGILFISPEMEMTVQDTLNDFLGGLGIRSTTIRTLPQPAPAALSGTVYQLKVTLRDTHPPIWRRIQLRGDMRLSQLHRVLQIAMGWTDSHLHQFRVGGRYYGIPDREFGDSETINESRIRLNQIAQTDKARFVYEYDFGDSWEHEISVEKIFKPAQLLKHPVCVAGKRACPPEDVGGIWGYEHFLQVVRDPGDPEQEDLLEWIGGEFDPEAFDLDAVNRALARIK